MPKTILRAAQKSFFFPMSEKVKSIMAVMLGLNWELSREVRFSCAAIKIIAKVVPDGNGSFLIAIKSTAELKIVHKV